MGNLSLESIQNAMSRTAADSRARTTAAQPQTLTLDAVKSAVSRYSPDVVHTPTNYGRGNIDLNARNDVGTYHIYPDVSRNQTVVIPGVVGQDYDSAVREYQNSGRYYAKFDGVDLAEDKTGAEPLRLSEMGSKAYAPANLSERAAETVDRSYNPETERQTPTQQAEAYIRQLQGETDPMAAFEADEERISQMQTERAAEQYRKLFGEASDSFLDSMGLATISGLNTFTTGLANLPTSGHAKTNAITDGLERVIAEERSEMGTATGGAFDMVSSLVANVPTILASNVAGPLMGAALTFAYTYGNDTKYAKENGHSDLDAMTYAFFDGLNQAFLDYITSGLPGVGQLPEAISDAISRNVTSAVGRLLLKTSVSAASEGAQEMVQTAIENGLKNALLKENNDAGLFSEEALYSGLLGALTAGLTDGAVEGTAELSNRLSEVRFSVPGNKKADLSTAQQWVVEKFGKQKTTVTIKGIGEFTADGSGLVTAIRNTADIDQAVAFAAMQQVLKKGAVFGKEGDERIAVVSPVRLNGNEHVMKVTALKTGDGQYRISGLALDDTTLYDGTAAQAEKNITDESNAAQDRRYDPSVDTTISQNESGVNTQYTQDRADYVPGTHEYGRIGVTPTALDRSFAAMDEGQRRAVLDRLVQDAGVQIEFDETLPAEGQYRDGVITVNPNTATPMSVIKHELTHYLEQSGQYNDFMNFVLESQAFKEWRGERSLGEMRAERIRLYAENGVTLKPYQANQEIVADFVGERLFRDVDALAELAQKKRNLFRRIYDWFVGLIQKHRGTPVERELRQMEQKFKEALHNIDSGTTDGDAKYSIVTLPDGRKYVKADRQVIHGDDPAEWAKQVKRYIDSTIREGKDVIVYGADGDPLTITDDTSGKARFRNDVRMADGTARPMTDNEYAAKLRAETHIDELAEVSKRTSKTVPDHKRHSFAKDGFHYRTAYFMDFDGSYYRLTISVGENGQVNTVYNVGKIKEAEHSLRGSKAVPETDTMRSASFDTSISQDNRGVNSEYTPEETKYSFAPTDAGLETFSDEQLRAELSRRHPKENPLTIAQLAEEDADTTPTLTRRGTGNRTGDGQSAFAESLQGATIFDERLKTLAATDTAISRYDSITNKETMEAANAALNEGGEAYVKAWHNKDTRSFTAEDIAAGFILMSRYQMVGDIQSEVAVAERLREIATKSGQAVQIFSILGRMTPEGMLRYAKQELSAAYEMMVKSRTHKWVEENKAKFELTDDEQEFILNRTWQAAQLPDGRDKQILLAEISGRIESKIPHERGEAFKAWQRTCMLLNPVTFLRNLLGNITITTHHVLADFIGAGVDKATSSLLKTGMRTKSVTQFGSVRGLKKGASEAFDDFRRSMKAGYKIDTRKTGEGRYEIGRRGTNNFNEHHTGRFTRLLNPLSHKLNALDRVTSFMLELGDRPFFEMYFMNSIEGQMKANGVTEATPEMIEVATTEALQKTWQDENAATEVVSLVKKAANIGGLLPYGFGDVAIKFTKTPANVAKAILEFSPVGVAKALAVDLTMFKRAVENGTATAQMQHHFVKNLANGLAGTLLTALTATAIALGIVEVTGEADEDKDVAAFERSVMGYQPYSVKIGGKWFSYDWAQPSAAQIAFVANLMQDVENAELTGEKLELSQIIQEAITVGGNILFEQSFMKSVQGMFESDQVMSNVFNLLLEDASANIPQVLSKTAQALDPTVRTTFEYDDSLETAWNKVLYKIPGARETLAPSVDVLGNEKQQYGNDAQRAIVSFFSVANVAEGYDSKAGDEVYRLYQKTGEAAVIPPQAPNYVSKNGGKVTLDSEQKAAYQKVTGRIATETVEGLLTSEGYKALSDDGKAELLTAVYSYARQAANKDVLGLALNESAAKAQAVIDKGIPVWQYFLLKKTADSDGNDAVSQEEAKAVLDASTLTKAQKEIMWTAFNSKWKYNPYKKRYY